MFIFLVIRCYIKCTSEINKNYVNFSTALRGFLDYLLKCVYCMVSPVSLYVFSICKPDLIIIVQYGGGAGPRKVDGWY